MDLSDEDTLRLNVLLMQNLQAIRIDEPRMQVIGLTDKGEAKIQLSRPSKDVIYLKKVRDLIANHVMNLPGGYPVFLDRWTRMGQNRDANVLKNLLLLGEPEAVVAVVHSPEITPEIARDAWWSMPEAENARCMLHNPVIARSDIGKELADFLFEFLPFENVPRAIFDSVRLILQPGLYDDNMQQKLWQWAQRKATINIGLLQAMPDDLPEKQPAHPLHDTISNQLVDLITAGNVQAKSLQKALSVEGQTFLNTARLAMKHLADQQTAMALFDVIGNYFSDWSLALTDVTDTASACEQVEQQHADGALSVDMQAVINALPDYQDQVLGAMALGQMHRDLLTSFFSRSNMVGSLMRKKLAPWTEPLKTQLARLTC